jgi:acyl-coenzyme A synthetase/AMP-(fatty) acid ligase
MATTIERPAPAPPVVTVPDQFNIADYLVDRHLREGHGGRIAVLFGDESVTYAQVVNRSNRLGNGLRSLGVRREERVLLLLLDTPAFVYSFFGAQKIGAVPIPTNTLLKSQDYRYMLNDSRARVVVVSAALLPQLSAIPRDDLPYLEHVVVDGVTTDDLVGFNQLLDFPAELETEPTSKDDAAFWLYSSGTTGFPKGAVHLHHDILHTVVCYAQGRSSSLPTDWVMR